ncbi:MAG: hypothetical protein ACRDHO_07055 [Actinomycetota bacterium]
MTEPETITEHYQHDLGDGRGEFVDRPSFGQGSRQPEEHAQRNGPREPSTRSVAEHVSSLLLSADETARRIVEEAEAKSKDQLAEIDRRVRWMEAETARLASWSRQTEEMIQALGSAVEGFRNDVEGVPQRISEALSPLASHVPHLVRQMNELMGALNPPPAPGASEQPPAEENWVEGWHDLNEEPH